MTRHRIGIALVGAAPIAAIANAGFTGWVGRFRDTGTHYLIDVYAGMSASTDKLLNVFNANISVSANWTFLQGSTTLTSRWRPALGVATINDIDSFVTLGGYSDGGVIYCGETTTGDPNFTNYATPNATTIAANAGWYSSDPTSPDIVAVNLSSMPGYTMMSSAIANFGVWVAHFAILKIPGVNEYGAVTISASAAFNTGTNASDQRTLGWLPSPGALALLGMAGLAPRRRRS